MAIHKLFHGTTAEAYEKIMCHGFNNSDQIMIWNESQDNMVYFWDADLLAEADGYDDMDQEYREHAAITQAFESATIGAALYSKSNQIYVIECTIDDTTVSTLRRDQCRNMAGSGAMQIHWTEVKKHHVTAVYTAPFSQRCALLYLTALANRDDDIDLYRHLKPYEIDVLRTLAEKGIYIEELREYNYTKF